MNRITLLSGGVGGARLARGLDALDDVELSVIVNVGDDDTIYGLDVSPDIDTVVYTLAGVEGERGWGLVDDDLTVMQALSAFPIDTSFQVGDRDLATNLFRTKLRSDGVPLSEVTRLISAAFSVNAAVMPATDDPVKTRVKVEQENWLRFQEYFVVRSHRDEVLDVRFDGADDARPAPGVLEAISDAEAVVIAPSNPPLSIWPILAIPGIAEAIANARRVICVSPLFGGRALKGPAHAVLRSLGMSAGNRGVLEAYNGLLHDFVIDLGDAPDRSRLDGMGVRIHVRDTRIAEPSASEDFAAWMVELL